MDDLMTEASGLVLSSGRSDTVTSERSLRPDKDPVFESYVSSVALLKSSILNSINNRCTEVEMIPQKNGSMIQCSARREFPEDKTTRTRKSKKYKDPTVGARVDIQPLRDKTPSAEEPPCCQVLAEDVQVSVTPETTSTRIDFSHLAFTRLLRRTGDHQGGDVPDADSRKEILEKEAGSKKKVENGLKLARRKSSTIFENCSTYHLACSEVALQSEDDEVLPAGHSSSAELVCESSAEGAVVVAAHKPPSLNNDGAETDDPVSLGDSFFASVTDGVELSLRRRAISSRDVKSMILSSSAAAESDAAENSDDKTSGVHPKGRRSGKRARKRQKKNRQKNCSSVYTCPKCRVSYSLSRNAPMCTVRCLHCDYWTSVEPVFVKQEKMAWNICLIC